MKIKDALSLADLKSFFSLPQKIYRNNRYYKNTEASIIRLVVQGSKSFLSHAIVKPKLIINEDDEVCGRFALISDNHIPDYVQVGFFETSAGIENLYSRIKEVIKEDFPGKRKIIIGLGGHLNYSAGILISDFDKPPLFGLPYSQPYYKNYFKDLKVQKMVSYRMELNQLNDYLKAAVANIDFKGITTRFIDKKEIKKEIKIYNYLDNTIFKKHPFWSDRSEYEDYELVYPIRHFLDDENIVIAEYNNKPIGFLLWYPDFNQLTGSAARLNLSALIKYRLGFPINTFRLTQIAVLPEFQNMPVTLAMFARIIPVVVKRKFKFIEGGVIFEDNFNCTNMVQKFFKRVLGSKGEPYREYAIFEDEIV